MTDSIQAYLSYVDNFFRSVVNNSIEIYNEPSLQFEFGYYLRNHLPEGHKVQFERPVDYFGLSKQAYVKREIDVSVFVERTKPIIALEFKFPRNGRHPETMFDSCTDICFLEQLVSGCFGSGIFVMAADDPLFWSGKDNRKVVYQFFRRGRPLCGTIPKPTGDGESKHPPVTIAGSYSLEWKRAGNRLQYLAVPVLPRATTAPMGFHK